MPMTATSSISVGSEPRIPQRRLVPLSTHAADVGAFSGPAEATPKVRPVTLARAKQALLDDLRRLVLQGVEPRQDGLECSPTEGSLAVAEQLISSLHDDVAMPSVSLPDDGEITFSWQTVDDAGEQWRCVLVIAPDSEVECFVRRRSDHRPTAHFRAEGGVGPLKLPDDIVRMVRSHWPI